MRYRNLIEYAAGTFVGRKPASETAFSEEDTDGIDPYQEYYNFLVAGGTAPAAAWDRIWANPAQSMDIGWKLATMGPSVLSSAA